ncbi:Uncharacterized protein MLTONO_p0561 (plasmid) [Mesorhizobium loti]|nr:Uncharacterized protein MLTONO_p0561 [Mesorhizobium loti]
MEPDFGTSFSVKGELTMHALHFDPSKLVLIMKATLAGITILAVCAAVGCSVMHPAGF